MNVVNIFIRFSLRVFDNCMQKTLTNTSTKYVLVALKSYELYTPSIDFGCYVNTSNKFSNLDKKINRGIGSLLKLVSQSILYHILVLKHILQHTYVLTHVLSLKTCHRSVLVVN